MELPFILFYRSSLQGSGFMSPRSRKPGDTMSMENFNTHPLESFHPDRLIPIEEYEPFIGKDRVEEMKRLVEPVVGKGWTNLNSTLIGGGVAEILRSAIPLARGMGIDANWHVIRGSNEFFKVTKKFHNLLQGVSQPITLEEIFGAYLDVIHENARNTFIASDLVVIHDPQPAALIMNGMIYGNLLWRCHIDTSSPDKNIWRFLLPYINHTGGAIFTMKEFVGPGLQVPVYEITPSIDPLASKNRKYSDEEARDILADLFHIYNIDEKRPILAAVSRYDIHKNQKTIIKAFKSLKKYRKLSPPPYLIFLGNTATDDPEGGEILDQLKEMAGDDEDILFWVNVQDNDRVVGALMALARAFIHVSTREGFGLVVTEALWQGTPVIGSSVGGITRQVIDGKTGFSVNPEDPGTLSEYMLRVLENRAESEALGAAGRELVRERFLLPEQLRKYIILLRHYTGVDRDVPDFRLNELSYSELLRSFSYRNPSLKKPQS